MSEQLFNAERFHSAAEMAAFQRGEMSQPRRQEKWDEPRADIIGQNCNDGQHYDAVLNPQHYQLLPGIEVINVREALLKKIGEKGALDAVQIDLWSRAWEYLTRFMDKGGKEDLMKAENYLHRLNSGEWMK